MHSNTVEFAGGKVQGKDTEYEVLVPFLQIVLLKNISKKKKKKK